MPPTPARVAAFDILLKVEKQDAFASELLHSEQYSRLSRQDHGLVTEIVMGVLRWRPVLDAALVEHSSQRLERLDPEVLTALRIAAYQMRFLSGVPMRAAVNESVELVKHARKRSAAPFVNAVLRKLAGAAKPGAQITHDAAAEIAQSYAHPLWLVERWVREFGLEAARKICEYGQSVPAAAVHLANVSLEAELAQEGIELEPGKLLTSARRVRAGPIASTRAFREGKVSIQDEASQLVAFLVGKGSSILDCCASPGGKTRILAERNPSAPVIAVELHPHRARLLRELVTATNVEVVTGDVRDVVRDRKFDRVLVDVPCSGTGTLAHNPEIKWRLSAEDLQDLQTRQLTILKSAMQRVAAGGRLVYSTCSLEREENADVIQEALAADDSLCAVPCSEILQQMRAQGELAWTDMDSLVSGTFLRTIPGQHPCDGFFAAVLEKK